MAFSIPWTEPRRRHRRGRPAPGWLLVAVSLAAACGPESARAPAAVDVLSEGREMGAAAGEARDPLARFVVTRGNTATCPWTVEGAERSGFTLLQPTEGAFDRFEMIPGLALYGADELSVTQPAPHRAGDVGAVAARLWCGGSAGTRSVRAVAIDERGEARETSAWRSVAVGVEPRFVEFELAPSMEAGAARAGVRIEFAAGGPWAAVASVAVFGPGPPGPRVGWPELVFVGSTAMRAATLVEDAPWEVRFRGDGVEPQRLRMALARRGTEQLPRDAGLFVAVEAARRGEQLCVRALDLGALEDSHWSERDVDLGVLPARDCVLRLWLEGGEGGPARLLVGDAAVVRSTPAPPTVLLITSDTHRADHLGAVDASLRTPALDALAHRGLRFERAYSTTTITNPGHVALMTGLHPRDTRIVDNKTRLATSVDTLAEAFQAAGYRTFAAVSTEHLGPRVSGLGQGFARVDAPDVAKRRGRVAAERVFDWLGRADGEPVFAWVHVFDAHAPYAPPEPFRAEATDGVSRTAAGGLGIDPRLVPGWVHAEGISNRAYVRSLYAGEVEALDAALARLLGAPRVRAGTVAFTADHGENLTEHQVDWDHVGAYLPTLAVPLVVAGPGVAPGTSARPVQQHHVARTLLDLAGLDADLPGRNLLAEAARGGADDPLFALAGFGLQASVVLGEWHLVLDLRSYVHTRRRHDWSKGRARLYDRRDGLGTEVDRSAEYPEIAAKLRNALLDWLARAPAEGLGTGAPLSAGTLGNLEALGYTGFRPTVGPWYTPEVSGAARTPR